MKFVDEVRIHVKAGDGGNGAVAFRREKYVDRGGPSGGDGGNGGSVIFEADPQLTTLLDYRYQQHHRAKNGEGGMGSDCNGRSSDDLILKVPVGTLIRDADTDEVLADLNTAGERVVVCKGGRGGLGNMNFATSTRQTPRFAQDGTPGEERTLRLELKLLADVGLLGYPNAGKSTLISIVSRARPKIADYPFTTLVPNLGLVQYKDGLSFVMADIPGLIEGASEGVGLGLQFLRHVERCKVLIHLLDMGAEGEGRDPLHDFDVLNGELRKYSEELARKPQVVAANKLDLPHAQERLAPLTEEMRKRGIAVFPVSCATGQGMQPLLDAVAEVLFTGKTDKLHVEPPPKPKAEKKAPPSERRPAEAPVKKAAEKKKAPAKKVAVKPAAKKAPVKKAAAKKAPVRKAAAKKVPAKKAAAKKAPVRKAAAKKVAARKAPAKKAPVKKAPARRAPAKKAAPKRARRS
ncbi:GTPase ObgE [Archangium minus]|uniref:GTPase Obg n=1 Tax=Archangium minus TaxID=83450 RepID=A0ABY9X3C1_9BACT|nr:GTPase ObgE [Archangium minus]